MTSVAEGSAGRAGDRNGGGDGRVRGSREQRRFVLIVAVVGLMLSIIAPMMTLASQVDAQGWSPPRTVYMAETGHSLDQVFLDQWREGGGAAAFGYPVTPEITQDDGTIVQYLQYARFEWHPGGNADGVNFTLGAIGEELRPFNLQRSVASFTAPTGDQATSIGATAFSSAWMPVVAPETETGQIRYVEATQHTVRYSMLAFWDRTGGESYLGNPLTEEYQIDGTTYQVFERGQLAWENGREPWMMPVGEMLADKYRLPQDPVAQGDLPTYSEQLFVPPPTPTPVPVQRDSPAGGGEKVIEIDLGSQYLIAWEGDSVFLETYVSTGRPGFDTPTGTFSVNVKYPSDDMEGVLGGEYYNVPEVPDVMYFTGVGHAIHGAYWHNNFGAVMSHGCINVPTGTSAALYDWAPSGTKVVIHD